MWVHVGLHVDNSTHNNSMSIINPIPPKLEVSTVYVYDTDTFLRKRSGVVNIKLGKPLSRTQLS